MTTRAWVSGSLLAGPASGRHGATLPRRPARHRRAPPLTPGPRPTCSVQQKERPLVPEGRLPVRGDTGSPTGLTANAQEAGNEEITVGLSPRSRA